MAKDTIQSASAITEQNEKEGVALSSVNRCWDCPGGVENFFCKRCGKIQPIPGSADYFSTLGLERRLNYGQQEVEEQFHTLSRKFHPDFYQSKSLKEQELSLENASTLNKAYRTLRDPISKIEYLIQLELGEGEGIRCQVPPDLLEEVLDLHSQLEEIHSLKEGSDTPEKVKIKEYLRSELIKLEERFRVIDDQILALSDNWNFLEKGVQEPQLEKKKILLDLRNLLSQRTYLSNVIEEIKKTL